MNTFFAVFLVALAVIPLSAAPAGHQEPANKAHDSAVDGRWEVKANAGEQPVIEFEFKNAAGVLTGMMIRDGKSTEIKNGSLEGGGLKFETTQVREGADPVTTTWSGTIVSDGNAINLVCAPVTRGDGGGQSLRMNMQARRVK
jgi:hypothetical protein